MGADRRVRNLTKPEQCALRRTTDLTLTESAITAFGGLRVPLGVPNLDLYGTVGARNFYSGPSSLSAARSDCSTGQKP